MHTEQRKNILAGWLFTALFILLYMNTLIRGRYPELVGFGDTCITISLLLMAVFLLFSWWPRQSSGSLSYKQLYWPIALLILVYTWGYLMKSTLDFFTFFKVLLLYIYALAVARARWDEGNVKFAGLLTLLAMLLLLASWKMNDFTFNLFKGFYRNENFLAVFLFAMLYFLILPLKTSRPVMRLVYAVAIVINLMMIVATGSRSLLLGVLVTASAWLFLNVWRKRFGLLFYLVVIGNFLFMAVYVFLKDTRIGNSLNDLSRTIFNKNLFSGRVEIWGQLVQAIKSHPFLGYGVGTKASDVTAFSLSAHNLYLQLLLEIGAVGFVLFLMVLWGIWRLLNKRLDQHVSRWSACFMLGILVYETFELTLTQNNYSIAMFQWLIMTMGVGFAARQEALPQTVTEEGGFPETRVQRKARNRRKQTGWNRR